MHPRDECFIVLLICVTVKCILHQSMCAFCVDHMVKRPFQSICILLGHTREVNTYVGHCTSDSNLLGFRKNVKNSFNFRCFSEFLHFFLQHFSQICLQKINNMFAENKIGILSCYSGLQNLCLSLYI